MVLCKKEYLIRTFHAKKAHCLKQMVLNNITDDPILQQRNEVKQSMFDVNTKNKEMSLSYLVKVSTTS